MNALLRLAVRNLLKNRRRSLYAILAIALGYAAVNVFGGFTRYINSNLRDSFIYNQGHGHLSIFRAGFLEKGLLDPARYLLTAADLDSIAAALAGDPEVLLVTPQLYVTGLLGTGSTSTIFIGAGRVPSDTERIVALAPGMLGRLRPRDGEALRDDRPDGIAVAAGLAALLDLERGSAVTAVAPTIDGQVNAVDAEVLQTFESAVELLNDKLVVLPLALARSLYDTDRADRVTVVLHDTARTAGVHERLAARFAGSGLDLEIRTWADLSTMYQKVRRMFDIIFFFVFVIVLVIAAMSVINTVNMAVMERIREIGTLRALGMRRARIVALFALESGILGGVGSVVGIGLTVATWWGIREAGPTWIPPMITQRIPLEVYLVPEHLVLSCVFLLALAVGAATFPARRAARMGIVDALGHV